MPTTVNKGYTVPVTGTESGTWGDDINLNFTSTVDLNLGGALTKTLAASPVTLTAAEAKNAILRFTGTLTADVTVTNPNIGFYFVENLTSGAFVLTITNGVSGVVVPSGARAALIATTANGVRIAALSGFEPGVSTVFLNAAAPVGWVKSTTHNNKALRIVNTTGGGSGGTVAFDVALAPQTPTGTISGTALSVAQLPAHTFTTTNKYFSTTTYGGGDTIIKVLLDPLSTAFTGNSNPTTSSSVGSGSTHTHTFTGTSINLDVQHVDAIICTKS